MAGYKETPRQKMIGMMYLVLTALLALNVSVELLNAFLVVNDSMEITNANFDAKAGSVYAAFERAYAASPDKVGPFWEKAKRARELSDGLKKYITQTKYDVLAFSDKISVEEAMKMQLVDFKTKDKYDEATVFFTKGSVDGSKGKARELKNKIEEYKAEMIKLVDPKYHATLKLGLKTDGEYKDASGNKENWEMHNFNHTILAADVVILNKLLAEVTNAELDVVNVLQSSISADDFKFDQVAATVVPKSQYIFMGENYEADVFLTAMDSRQNFTASIGGRSVTSTAGVAKLVFPGNVEGPKSFTGSVSAKSPSGEVKSYPISIEYIVAPPTFSIAPTKMNVLYIGVDNPISISAGGVSSGQLSASITQGSITRSGSTWIAKVTNPGKANISVSANVGGKSKNMGSFEFRTKLVPPPTATIGGVDGGNLSRDVAVAAGALIPRNAQDFEFEVFFTITSFKFAVNRKGDYTELNGNGNRLTEQMKELIRTSRRGDRVWFDDIYAKGPDGKSRKLNSIVLIIQ